MASISGVSNQDPQNLATLVLQRHSQKSNFVVSTFANAAKQVRENYEEEQKWEKIDNPDETTDDSTDYSPPKLPDPRPPVLGTNWRALLNFTPV